MVCLSNLASTLEVIFAGRAVTARGTARKVTEHKGRTRAIAMMMLQIAFVALKVPVPRRSCRADYKQLSE